MSQSNDDFVFRLRRYFKAGGNSRDHQRVVARRRKSLRQALKQSFTVVKNFADLTMHQGRRSHDFAAEHLTDGLMAQTHTQYGYGFMQAPDDVFSNTRIRRSSRTGRNHDS